MSGEVRCRICNGVCPPARRYVLYNAENDYTSTAILFFKAYGLFIRRGLAILVEIAEIMRIGPSRKLKVIRKILVLERKEKQYHPRQIRLDLHHRKHRDLTKEIVDFQPDHCSVPTTKHRYDDII